MSKTILILTDTPAGQNIIVDTLISELNVEPEYEGPVISFHWDEGFLYVGNLDGSNIDCDIENIPELAMLPAFTLTLISALTYYVLIEVIDLLPADLKFTVSVGVERLVSRQESIAFMQAWPALPEFLWADEE